MIYTAIGDQRRLRWQAMHAVSTNYMGLRRAGRECGARLGKLIGFVSGRGTNRCKHGIVLVTFVTVVDK